MGNSFRKLYDKLFGKRELRLVLLGLQAAGKSTILFKLRLGELVHVVSTPAPVVEKIEYKRISLTAWDVGGQGADFLARPLWQHYVKNTMGLIYVVDSHDRERMGRAAFEFKQIIEDPMMQHVAILVLANKQDMKGALTTAEVCEALDLPQLRDRKWHVQGAIAISGEGLYEGLDWLSYAVASLQRPG